VKAATASAKCAYHMETSVTSVLALFLPRRRRRGFARPADGNVRHPSCKDTHTPPKCTTANHTSKCWIGPSPNPRSCRAPSLKDRHGESKREDVSEHKRRKEARQSAERLQQRERRAHLLTTRYPPPRLPLFPRLWKNRSRTSQSVASNRAGVSHAGSSTSEPFYAVS
jgi:hypothetical protein